jgi:hypothetical protein
MLTGIGLLLSIARHARYDPDELFETEGLPDLAASQISS